MGIPLRSGGGGAFQVSIRPLVKTCPEEAGIFDLELPNGTRVIAIAHALWPSHDRGLVDAVKKLLADKRPAIVVMLGGMVHEEAFKHVVDADDVIARLVSTTQVPEIVQVRTEHEGMEERFLALAKLAGEFIASFAEVSGAHVVYIPSVTGFMPNEIDIMRFVLTQKEKADNYAERHPKEAVLGPDIPKGFAEFLGLAGNPNVTVLPFGAALRINKKTRFIVGDFRRRQPGGAVCVDVEQIGENVVRGFDGKVASAWWTTPVHSFGEAKRRHWQGHEVGNLFDLKAQLGYLRNYDKRCKGLWSGVVWDNILHGYSAFALAGKDGRRSLFVDDVVYEEDVATARGNVYPLVLPARKPTAGPDIHPVKPDAKPVKAKPTSPKAKKAPAKGSAKPKATRKPKKKK